MDLHIDGRNMKVNEHWRAEITQRMEDLVKGHEDIVHARVTLSRNRHHRQADDAAEAVAVIHVPGHTITARKQEQTVEQAIHATLDALEVELKKIREKLASHEVAQRVQSGPVRGIISKILFDEGYGFIQPETGEEEVYFHRNAVHDIRFEDLTDGMEVTFNVEPGEKGPHATTVNPVPTIKVVKGES